MNSTANCKHLTQPSNGITLAGTATVFTCPWCAIERLERELAASNAALLQRQDKFCTVEADRDRLRVELERIYRIAKDWRHLSDMRGRVCGIAEAALEPAPAAQRPESETGATSE